MANVFKNVTEVNNKVNKSTFDLSFQNNLTMQFGYLYPCFVKKFAPGTKVKIKPTFGLNFMPMMFPVQTRMRARMSFYKVRCRSLWKDYKDWFGNLKPNLVKPYIDFNSEDKLKKMASTGSLGDYLGLPTCYSAFASSPSSSIDSPTPYVENWYDVTSPSFVGVSAQDYATRLLVMNQENTLRPHNSGQLGTYEEMPFGVYIFSSSSEYRNVSIDYSLNTGMFNPVTKVDLSEYISFIKPFFTSVAYREVGGTSLVGASVIENDTVSVTYDSSSKTLSVSFSFDIPDEYVGYDVALIIPNSIRMANASSLGVSLIAPYPVDSSSSTDFYIGVQKLVGGSSGDYFLQSPFSTSSLYTWNSSFSDALPPSPEVKDITLDSSPYYNSTSANKNKQLMIDASFFRAYESIYNAYFRDIRNNPYILNGQPEYNVFIPSDAGGADDNIYELRRRNWESDFLTTAVPSPQQGRAPLVGITTYNDTTSLAFTAEDGKKYAVNYDYDPEAGEMKNVSFQQLGDDAVVKEARNMMDLVSSGISISDLRNVNAYTKFLELNMRKGYFYKDLVEGHFDTKVRYDELNMPEFIGGTAKDVFVNPVSQTVQTSQDGSYFGALGSYAGQASVQGSADNTISAYFDEECIVIGLISVVPVANYSQLLPKHFLHRELLDSYFPEFDNIGFQPIFYDEVCPIQAFNDDPDSLKDVFGYQRPWYDYVASTDEVHGLFRTNLRNFLINRVFASKPTLSPDFLLVDPEQVNDVFSVTQTTDKILGQIYFDVTVNAPISRIAIPRLD